MFGIDLGILLVIGTLAATAVGAIGAIQQGRQQKDVAEYNARVAENQAEWAEYNARMEADMAREQARWAEMSAGLAIDEAGRNASNKRREVLQMMSTQRARYGSSGVTLAGTPLAVLEETATLGEYDADLLEYAGAIDAWNLRNEAKQYESKADVALLTGMQNVDLNRAQAGLYRAQGSQSEREGYFSAGATVLTGATKAAGYYQGYKTSKK